MGDGRRSTTDFNHYEIAGAPTHPNELGRRDQDPARLAQGALSSDQYLQGSRRGKREKIALMCELDFTID